MMDLAFGGRRLVFESPLSREEVTRRLEREVSPPAFHFIDRRTQTFEGTFSSDRFQMSRLVKGKNTFRTFIDGQLSSGISGTRIDVRLRAHPAVTVVLVMMVAAAAIVASIVVPEWQSNRVPPLPFVAILVLVFCGFPLIMAVEARMATRMLASLFEVEALGPGGIHRRANLN